MSTPNSVPPSFKVPFNIPGAPERTTVPELMDSVKPLVQTSIDSMQNKPGSYETALSQASWWHFWLLVAVSTIVSAISSAISSLLFENQIARLIPGYSVSILHTLVVLI